MSNYQQYGPPQYPGQPQQPLPPAFPQHQYGQQYAGPPPQSGYGWGPQFGPPGMPPGPPGWQPPRPPKRRNTGLILSLGLLGVLAVVALITVVGVALSNKGGDDPTVSQPTSTSSTSYTPSADPSAYPTAPPPSTRPTTTRPVPTRATSRPTTPPPDVPTDWEVVRKDGFYFTGLHNSVGCRESRARPSNISAATVYLRTMKTCLDRAWPAQVRKGRDTFRAPSLVVMNGTVGTTPCGGGSAFRSFYCGSNQTIYMDALTRIRNYNQAGRYSNASQIRLFNRMALSQTMAHEYGHHLQELTGISSAFDRIWYDESNYSRRLEVNRRMELQASCLGAVFMGANRTTFPVTGRARSEWNWLVIHSGDEYDTERTHGSRIVHNYWSQRGFASRNTNLCNTFTAGSSLVR
ncbi:neutral zinc metallopeptidase [Kribbella deserti]|uniref:Neutral zinc metallopeptidase n=1 Tax=Kribbella deserti TaxID=1926257 RepID=A0ABV6QFZ3_9ACTN